MSDFLACILFALNYSSLFFVTLVILAYSYNQCCIFWFSFIEKNAYYNYGYIEISCEKGHMEFDHPRRWWILCI